MFLSKGAFGKIIREAYKNKYLKILNENGDLVIDALWWKIRINQAMIPNKAKAALIEVCGDFPKEGEQYSVEPEGNQIEMPTAWVLNCDEGMKEVVKTDFRVGRACLLQDPVSFEIHGVQDIFFDNTGIVYQENGEDPCRGPFIKDGWVLWANSAMTLQTVRRDLKAYAAAISALEEQNIEKEEP